MYFHQQACTKGRPSDWAEAGAFESIYLGYRLCLRVALGTLCGALIGWIYNKITSLRN